MTGTMVSPPAPERAPHGLPEIVNSQGAYRRSGGRAASSPRRRRAVSPASPVGPFRAGSTSGASAAVPERVSRARRDPSSARGHSRSLRCRTEIVTMAAERKPRPKRRAQWETQRGLDVVRAIYLRWIFGRAKGDRVAVITRDLRRGAEDRSNGSREHRGCPVSAEIVEPEQPSPAGRRV
jgi:hypothetical protein